MIESAPLYNSRITKIYIQYLTKYYPDVDIDAVLNEAGIDIDIRIIFSEILNIDFCYAAVVKGG